MLKIRQFYDNTSYQSNVIAGEGFAFIEVSSFCVKVGFEACFRVQNFRNYLNCKLVKN